MAQQLQELYEQVLSDLQNGQQELEMSAQQAEEWCCECEEAKQLHDMTIAKMAELEEENWHVAKQKVDLGLQRQCEYQELERYWASNIQCQQKKE